MTACTLQTSVKVLSLGWFPQIRRAMDGALVDVAQAASRIICPPRTITANDGLASKVYGVAGPLPDCASSCLEWPQRGCPFNEGIIHEKRIECMIRVSASILYQDRPGSAVQRCAGFFMVVQLDNGSLLLWPNESDEGRSCQAWSDGDVLSVTIHSVTCSTDRKPAGGGRPRASGCFVQGTRIKTLKGSVPVEALRADDEVLTLDHGWEPVRWVAARTFDITKLREHPDLLPIRIRAGSLGDSIPEQDLLLAPDHRILVCSRTAQLMFGAREFLVPVKFLVGLKGVDVALDLPQVRYCYLMFSGHEIIWANGTPCESLDNVSKFVQGSDTPAELEDNFALADPGPAGRGEAWESARPLLNERQARGFAKRLAGEMREACIDQVDMYLPDWISRSKADLESHDN